MSARFRALARPNAVASHLTTWAVIAAGKHLFPFRTEKLSPLAPMVLGEQSPGRVGRRPFLSPTEPEPTGSVVGRGRSGRLATSGGAKLLAPVRIERAQALRTRSPSGGWVTNSVARPSSAKGLAV